MRTQNQKKLRSRPVVLAALVVLSGLMLVFSVLSLGASSAMAASRACGIVPAGLPKTELEIENGEITYNFDKNTVQLVALRNETTGTKPEAGWKTTGLTHGELRYTLEIGVRVYRVSNGYYCARLKKLRVNLGYSKLDVYVSNEYPKGSCEYEAVLDHENRHVKIYRSVLREFTPKIDRMLTREANKLGWVATNLPNKAASKLRAKLRPKISAIIDEMNAKQRKLNRAMDTPENYRAEQKQCSNW